MDFSVSKPKRNEITMQCQNWGKKKERKGVQEDVQE